MSHHHEDDKKRFGCILVADDDAGIRSMLVHALTSAGWRKVLTAANGVAAVEEVDRHNGAIDVVLMDLELPMMHGTDAARMIRAQYPDIGILFISGEFHEQRLPAGFPLWGILLAKPFRLRELTDAIQRVMARGSRMASAQVV